MSAFKPLPPSITPLTAGIHENIPSARYHADELVEMPSLNSGVLRTLVEQTPAHAHREHVRLGGVKREQTAQMIQGGFVHGIMSGDLHEFLVGDFDNYTTKDARGWRDAALLAGRTPILQKTVDKAERIANALKEKIGRWNLTNDPVKTGKPEVTILWEEDGFWFRARLDRLILDPTYYADVWDYKTTGNGVSQDALERMVIDQGYHIQAAFYLRGLNAVAPEWRGRQSFTLAVVEDDEPHAVRRVPIQEGFLSLGARIVDQGIGLWKECMRTNTWSDGSDVPVILTPPTWYLKKIEEAA